MPTLKGITWDHPRGYVGLEAAGRLYKAQQNVDVQWDRRSLQAFAEEPIDLLAKSYDLIVLDHPHIGLIAEQGALLQLDDTLGGISASLGGSLESYVWAGSQWALPIDAACQMAVLRPDLKPNLLQNWSDLRNASPSDFRLLTPLLPVDAFDMMMTLVASLGEVHLPHSQAHFTSERNGLAALEVLKALYKLGPPEAHQWNPIAVLEVLSTTDEFAFSPCLFGYINYARPGFRTHQLAYHELPTFAGHGPARGILGGAGIGVSSRSQHAEQAKHFAAWVASEPIQSGVYLHNEGQPAHPITWKQAGSDPKFNGFLRGGYNAMANAWTRPREPWFLGFVDDVCLLFPDFFTKDKSAESMQHDINALYRKHSEKRSQ